MSQSSSDVFSEIVHMARLAEQESKDAQFYSALTRINEIEYSIKQARKLLEYEIECKCIVEAEDRKFLDNPDSL